MKKLLLVTAGLYISQMLYAQTPVAYYPFSGNANDAVGINNGTVSGATLTANRFGNVNSAYSFDGVDDRINAPLATTAVDNFSVEGWAKISSLSGDNQIIFHNGNSFLNGWGLLISSTGTLVVLYGGTSYNATPFLCSLNQWYHFALVRANGITKAYANGSEVFSSAIGAPPAPTNNFCIGNMSTGSNFFKGIIDNVKVYNTALTAQQVSDLFNNIEFCNGIDDDEDGLIDEVCIPTVSITGKSINEGNSDTTDVKLTVTLSNAYESTVSVKYKTANKTATAGSDYLGLNKTIKFNPGQTSKKITLQVLGDITVEPNEDLYVILSNPVNATLSAADTATVKIKNDDVAAAVVSATSDAAAVSSIAVKLSPNPAKNILTITGLRAGKSTIEITDMQGRAVAKENTSSSIATVNIAGLVPGMYMLKYFDGSSYKTVKFIKE